MKACIERKITHTHTHWTKSEESLKTTAKRVVIKTSACRSSRNIHTWHFFFFKNPHVCFFYVGGWNHHFLPHQVLFTILCQCAKQCSGTKWCCKKATSSLFFSFFRTSMNRAAFLPHCSHSRVKQVAGRETEEKNSSKDEPCSPSRPLKEGHYT